MRIEGRVMKYFPDDMEMAVPATEKPSADGHQSPPTTVPRREQASSDRGPAIEREEVRMRAKKQVSEKQAAANRRNAEQSTGPRTPSGKKTAARNALQHGLLASEIVITGGDGKESVEEFAALLAGLRDDYDPQSMLEDLLVENIAKCFWRLRRSIRCEHGQIRSYLDTAIRDREQRRRDSFEIDKSRVAGAPHINAPGLDRSSLGIKYLMGLWDEASSEVRTDGFISEEVQKELLGAFRINGSPAIICKSYNQEMKKRREEKAGREEAAVRDELLNYIAEVRGELEKSLAPIQQKEQFETEAHLESLALASPESLDRIMRYETNIERQLYRAIDQLERLRRQRGGEFVPPPVTLNLAT